MFFFSTVFHIFKAKRAINDNAITTAASYWGWLHDGVQGHVAIQGLFDRF